MTEIPPCLSCRTHRPSLAPFSRRPCSAIETSPLSTWYSNVPLAMPTTFDQESSRSHTRFAVRKLPLLHCPVASTKRHAPTTALLNTSSDVCPLLSVAAPASACDTVPVVQLKSSAGKGRGGAGGAAVTTAGVVAETVKHATDWVMRTNQTWIVRFIGQRPLINPPSAHRASLPVREWSGGDAIWGAFLQFAFTFDPPHVANDSRTLSPSLLRPNLSPSSFGDKGEKLRRKTRGSRPLIFLPARRHSLRKKARRQPGPSPRIVHRNTITSSRARRRRRRCRYPRPGSPGRCPGCLPTS